MELKNQVVSLDLAKRMKELRFEQESLFWWLSECSSRTGMIPKITGVEYLNGETPKIMKSIFSYTSAYTVAELGEMLPIYIKDINKNFAYLDNWLGVKLLNNKWEVSYSRNSEKQNIVIVAKTEADARAKMLIYLRENKLI